MNQHGIWSGNRPNPFLVLHLRVLPRSESRRGRVRRKTSPAVGLEKRIVQFLLTYSSGGTVPGKESNRVRK